LILAPNEAASLAAAQAAAGPLLPRQTSGPRSFEVTVQACDSIQTDDSDSDRDGPTNDLYDTDPTPRRL